MLQKLLEQLMRDKEDSIDDDNDDNNDNDDISRLEGNVPLPE